MPASLPNRINILPDSLVNRIAAGEVIERPASVVKELLENSLDAGANRLQIEIEKAGSRLIRITDNGSGIHRDDLALALDRHTTSKLHAASDLVRIATLGFRGEALSSIASVSRLSLVSRWQEDEQGWSINLPANSSNDVRPAAHPPGTRIEIRDLFYNTPARRKFLRSDKTEFMHIQEVIKRFALGEHGLSLLLVHNQRRVLQFADDSSQPLRRIQAVLGKQFTQQAIAINAQAGNMRLHGWIGSADLTRSSTDMQFVYLNGRIIRDKLVNHAIRLAYQDLVYPGRQPLYVIYLDMDLAAADINVHPTKHEVRFRDTRLVHDFIYGSLVRQLYPQSGQPTNNIPANSGYRDRAWTPPQPAGRAFDRIDDSPGTYSRGALHCLLQGQFILQERAGHLLVLDARKARTAIARSRMQPACEGQELPGRPLLVPVIYKTDNQTCEQLLAITGHLAVLAIELNRVSPASLQVRSLPRVLPFADCLALVDDLATWLKQAGPGSVHTAALIDRLADHANDLCPGDLTVDEMIVLLDEYQAVRSENAEHPDQGILRELDAASLREILCRGR